MVRIERKYTLLLTDNVRITKIQNLLLKSVRYAMNTASKMLFKLATPKKSNEQLQKKKNQSVHAQSCYSLSTLLTFH